MARKNDVDYILTDEDVFMMGKGVWYYHRGDTSFTLQFAYPYDLSAE